METKKKESPQNPFAGVTIDPRARKSLPVDHTLSDGRVIRLEQFQAKQFVDYVAEVSRQNKGKDADPLDIPIAILHGICFWVGKPDEQPTRVSRQEIDDLTEFDSMDLLEYISAEITEIKKDPDGTQSGILPSGRAIKWKQSTLRTLRDAQKANGPENATYVKIAMLCEIDGKPIDFVDVQIMDGLDFYAIQGVLGSRPT
jgi:hypothetical protein